MTCHDICESFKNEEVPKYASLAEKLVSRFWVQDISTVRTPRIWQTHLFARGVHLVLIPTSFTTSIITTLIGLLKATAYLTPIGRNAFEMTYEKDRVFDYLNSSRKIVVRPFRNLIKTINPKAKFAKEGDLGYNNGCLTGICNKALDQFAMNCRREGFFLRHAVSQLSYLLLAISSVVTRVVDLIIGTLAAVLALITAGNFKWINDKAQQGLQVTGIIEDLVYCIFKIYNPDSDIIDLYAPGTYIKS